MTQPFHRLMKPFAKIAVEFATALVEQRWEDAWLYLNPALRDKYTPTDLKSTFYGMFSYTDSPATQVHFDSKGVMEDWPTKKKSDVGWAYVSVLGDGCVEAVTVVVAESESGLSIREIEWGRP